MSTYTTIIVVCEGTTDSRVVRSLVPKVLTDLTVNDGDWLNAGMLGFRGYEPGSTFRPWSTLAGFNGLGRRYSRHGFRGPDDPWGPESEAAWKALLEAADLEGIDGAVLLRDGDASRGKPRESENRRRQLELAVRRFANTPDSFPVAFGIANPKVECWLLSAIDPTDSRVETTRKGRQLGFNPVTDAHLLDGAPGSKTDAKALLGDFMEPADWEVRLEETALPQLAERGELVGLTGFLREVRCNLGKLVVAHVPPCEWCDCGHPPASS